MLPRAQARDRKRKGAEPRRPAAQTSGSARGLERRRRRLISTPRPTPRTPVRQVMSPKRRLGTRQWEEGLVSLPAKLPSPPLHGLERKTVHPSCPHNPGLSRRSTQRKALSHHLVPRPGAWDSGQGSSLWSQDSNSPFPSLNHRLSSLHPLPPADHPTQPQSGYLSEEEQDSPGRQGGVSPKTTRERSKNAGAQRAKEPVTKATAVKPREDRMKLALQTVGREKVTLH